MPRRLLCLAALLTLPVASGLAGSTRVFASPAALIAELDRLKSNPGAVPDTWIVTAEGRTWPISTAPLRALASSPPQASLWLDHLAAELQSPESHPGLTGARKQLDTILAREEFAPAKAPNELELLMRRFGSWLASLFKRMLGNATLSPTTGIAIFWTLSAAVVAFLGFWLVRFWSRKGRMPALPPEAATAFLTSRQWIEAARAASAAGDLRTAVHCAYWAAIARLQELNLLPRDLTSTPREYLRALPPRDALREPLSALTRTLERSWYAGQSATVSDLEDSFAHLQALGCTLD